MELLHLVASVFLGLYAGALLTEAVILVPYWQRMEPRTFLSLHKTMGPHLFRFFAPLTTTAVMLAVASALVTPLDVLAGRHLAGAGALAALLIFFLYFKKANQSFADQTVDPNALEAELSRWSKWHWFRTVIVLAAFAFSVA